jgi:putative ABC transport system permease protein
MAIPIRYNVRNLILRKGLTAMTALGIALTVMTAVFLMMLLTGLQKAFTSSGDPLNVLVMRKGSNSELAGGFTSDKFPVLRELPGIAKDSGGQPIASPERVIVSVLPRKDGTGEVNVTVRGMGADGLLVRPKVKLAEGRWFTFGQKEVVVSKSIHSRFSHTDVGDDIDFGKGQWKVVGIFDGGGSAYDSEIWSDVNQVASQFNRSGAYGSVYLRATDAVTADALKHRVADDQRLELEGMLETDYYKNQTTSGAPIRVVGTLVAVIMAIGSCFAAANTMYAAVAYRSREIATLRVIGFRKGSIVISFVFEAILLALLGAVLGIIVMLPFNGFTTGTSNAVTFSEVEFSLRITPVIVLYAALFAIFMGLVGGVAPAWSAARRGILTALRD